MAAPPIPEIPPIERDERPLWSVVIPVHNCAEHLVHTLGTVVPQLEGRDDVEIVVVDDNSSDDPAAVVAEHGAGIVTYERLAEPHGAIPNFNHCLARSTGRLVHLLHGDDGVEPGFYAAVEAAFADDAVMSVVTRCNYVDEQGTVTTTTRSERTGSGRWDDALSVLAVSNRVRPAAIVARRDAYERIGGFRTDLPHAADWEMWMRLAAAGPMWFEDQVLAQYRVHAEQDTAGRVATGENITERIYAIGVVTEHLPARARGGVRRRGLGYSAVFAARTAVKAATRREFGTAARQLWQAARCVGFTLVPSRAFSSTESG